MFVFLISSILLLSAVVASKMILEKWINHLSLYSIIWWGMINLYELKLMRYIEISTFTWFAILGSFISFFFGVLFVGQYRKFIGKSGISYQKKELSFFNDSGKTVVWIIVGTLVLSTLFTIQHWAMLIKMYGSVPGVFLNANEIYRLRVDGKLTETIPYVSLISFVSIFFAGIYSAYKNKINILSVLTFLVLIVRQTADFSRAGILFGFFLFFTAFLMIRHFISLREKRNLKEQIKMASIVVILIAIVVGGAGLVRSTRGSVEHFQASSRALAGTTSGFFITPSLYLYLSSHIGVLNKYFEKDYYTDDAYIGESTFQPIYNFLSKFGAVEHIQFYDTGYFIPMWTNTATWLRQIYTDFGNPGLFLFPFFLAMVMTNSWFKFLEDGSFYHLVICIYIFVLILFSFLTLYTISALWYLSFLGTLGLYKPLMWQIGRIRRFRSFEAKKI